MTNLVNSYRFASGGAFSPIDLSPAMWLDASDTSTLYTSKVGGSTVTADGDLVRRWEDKSGNARHCSENLSTEYLTYKTGIQNGNPILRAAGASAFRPPSQFLSGATAGTAFFVAKSASDPAAVPNGPVISWGSSVNGPHYPWTDGNVYENFGKTARVAFNPTPSLASFRVVSIISAPSDYEFWLDGVSTFSTGTNTVGWASDPLVAAQTQNGVYYYYGDIAEIILFDNALSDTDRIDVENYLLDKWGV